MFSPFPVKGMHSHQYILFILFLLWSLNLCTIVSLTYLKFSFQKGASTTADEEEEEEEDIDFDEDFDGKFSLTSRIFFLAYNNLCSLEAKLTLQ